MRVNLERLVAQLNAFLELAEKYTIIHRKIVDRVLFARISMPKQLLYFYFLVQVSSDHPVIIRVEGKPFPVAHAVAQRISLLLVFNTPRFLQLVRIDTCQAPVGGGEVGIKFGRTFI